MITKLIAWRDAVIWEYALAGLSKGVESYLSGGSIPCKGCGGTGRSKSRYLELQGICPNCHATGTSNSNNNDWSGEYHRNSQLERVANALLTARVDELEGEK